MSSFVTSEKSFTKISCTQLHGVGPRLAQRLAQCDIHTIQDLLFHLPYRYQDRTRISPIATLRHGDHAVVEAHVESCQVQFGKRRSLLCKVRDGSGVMTLRFFHFNAYQQAQFTAGNKVRCFGQVRAMRPGVKEMAHPDYRVLNEDALNLVEETLTPIYHSIAGLTQTSWRKLTTQALALLDEGYEFEELLPHSLRDQFPSLQQAIAFLHRPPPDVQLSLLESGQHMMQQRLILEELVAHQLAVKQSRANAKHQTAPALIANDELQTKFLAKLPYPLTAAQQRVIAEIADDLQRDIPMSRLVQGDVGAGKTVVAACSALRAIAANYQVALMAPTEILAEQHFKNFTQWLAPLEKQVAWLSGKSGARERRDMRERVTLGLADVVVGTHALFQDQIRFHRLGLVIIDEQHRFGVEQRLALREKGAHGDVIPHQLIMTATPIPRTLTMMAYADLDVSIIDQLPPGRTPVKTVVLPNSRRDEVISRIEQICAAGQQVYWVCPLIEESETLQCQTASETAQSLQLALPNRRIALVHGRLRPEEKEAQMQAFKRGESDLLVATTVIEVGVDVPNASLMVIENPERFGLAQLHQLRGRVGRGAVESFCLLLYQAPLSETARERLQILRDSSDGFVIANKDLELRGPGEILGTQQTGLSHLRIADIVRDARLLPQVSALAELLLEQHPEQIPALIQRWLPNRERFVSV